MYIDTNIFIYIFEHHPVFGLIAAQLISEKQRISGLLTSTLTLAECLAQVTDVSVDTFHQLPDLRIAPLNEHVAVRGAELQRNHTIKIGDAIHLATAIEMGCDTFLTNDRKLASVAKNYLSVTVLSDYT